VPSKFLQCQQLSMRISTTSKRNASRYIMKVKFFLSVSLRYTQGAEVQLHSFLTVVPDVSQSFIMLRCDDKGKAIPVQAQPGPEASRRLKRGKVVSPRHRPPLLPQHTTANHYYQRLCRPQGHSAAGRMSTKSFNHTLGIEPAAFRLVVQLLN
jgi:hypothetical protein